MGSKQTNQPADRAIHNFKCGKIAKHGNILQLVAHVIFDDGSWFERRPDDDLTVSDGLWIGVILPIIIE